ncbi:glycosyltransferase family 61 protein [Blastomonas sp. SL216]|uniref:glycosyltransferase family 61 protein n=1 Tax=Blastomonas sp. SL216 TaxID=2995169 RepID=UPI00237728E1|nr:glycosyltransferase family 61 protein [Blastomonas sp. SL216]
MKGLLKAVAKAVVRPPRSVATTHAAYSAAHPDSWSEAFAADDRVRTPPRRFGTLDVDFASMIDPIPALGVYTLPNGRASGRSGKCCSSSGTVVRETTWYGQALYSSPSILSLRPPKRLAGTCLSLVCEFASDSYGHYLLDGVSRLGIALKAGWTLDAIDHVYIYEPPSKSARQMLGALGIAESKCVWANRVPEIVADRLLVTSFPGTRRNYARVVPDTLARPFQPVACAGRRLFVPRLGKRLIANAAEIEAISREMGLEIYDHARVSDEFSHFRQAELVVGAHGSGLTNIALCHPGTKVMELVPTDHVFPYYYTLADAAGLDYACLAGHSSQMREKGAWGPSHFDFTVDPEEYRAALGTLLAELDGC